MRSTAFFADYDKLLKSEDLLSIDDHTIDCSLDVAFHVDSFDFDDSLRSFVF